MGELIHRIVVMVAMVCATLMLAFVIGAVALFNLHPSAYLCVVPYAFIWLILIMESRS